MRERDDDDAAIETVSTLGVSNRTLFGRMRRSLVCSSKPFHEMDSVFESPLRRAVHPLTHEIEIYA